MALQRVDQTSQQLARSAVKIFAANESMNQILIEQIAPEAWTAKSPGNVRTIAAIFTHVHNVRTKWIRLTAPHFKIPRQLNRTHCTREGARAALAGSAERCEEMLAEAYTDDGRMKSFMRDGWAKPWPIGPEMLCYMVAHEAHHRGQVCMLAHQLGFKLPGKVTSAMWSWETLMR